MRDTRAARAIQDAYLSLLAKGPSAKITVTQIAQRAGVSRMTFYRLYEEREDVLVDVLDRLSEKGDALVEGLPDVVSPGDTSVLEVLEHHRRNMPILQTILASDMAPLLERRIENGVRTSLERHFPAEEDDGTPLFVTFYVAGIGRVVCDWIRSGCTKEPEEILEFFDSLALKLAP